MAKNESSKSKAEVYREERKARIAKAAKKNAKSIEKRTAAADILKKVVAVVLAVAIVGGIAWKIVDSLGVIERAVTAVNIGDDKITAAQFNYYYTAQYQQMAYYQNMYAQQGMSMGFDTSVAPDEQESTQKDEEGNALTWDEVFKDSAVNYAQFVYAYYNEAVKAGYKLTDDEKAEINETIESYRDEAATNNYSLNAYLRESFGGGFNEKAFRKQLEMETLAKNYSEDKATELETAVSDADIKAEYDANRKNYDYADVRYYAFAFTTLTLNDGETEEALKERQTAANAKVEAEAKAIFDKLTDEASFQAAITAYKNEGKENPTDDDYTTLSEITTYSSLTAATCKDAAEWAFDAVRKAGDKTMVKGDKAVYIIYSVKPVYAMNSVDVRHCLVQFDTEDTQNVTDAQKEAAQKEAKALLDEWLAGDKTEESFTAMVKENTDDTASKETGGLYEGIRTSDNYVAAFEEWSFDDARKAGDYGIVETEYGYHIMYFVSDNTDDLDWKATIKTAKGADALTAYEETLLAEDGEYSIEKHETWINMVAKNFCDNIRKNLAYSAA
ncbi:MAG: peptidylprolyl isomerase [Clostridia bacterium]|nr:peptidylprolyl isomerase [Clostridia bacterium]